MTIRASSTIADTDFRRLDAASHGRGQPSPASPLAIRWVATRKP